MSKIKMSWFLYFFIGFLCIAFALSIAGTTIAVYQNYTFMPNTPFESDSSWYHINLINNSFWNTFKALDKTMSTFLFKIPTIHTISILDYGSFSSISFLVDVVVFITNSLITLINMVINIYNGVVAITNTCLSFVTAFTVWISNGQSNIVPR